MQSLEKRMREKYDPREWRFLSERPWADSPLPPPPAKPSGGPGRAGPDPSFRLRLSSVPGTEMMYSEAIQKLKSYQARLSQLQETLKVEEAEKRLRELEGAMSDPGFWDRRNAQAAQE